MTARTLILVLAAGSIAAAADPPAPVTSSDYGPIRGICVQYGGRYQPLDTLARDVVTEISGASQYDDYDPVALLLAWTFNPGPWMNAPLIDIANAELRAELQLRADRAQFSYNELIAHDPLTRLIDELMHRDSDSKMNPLESKVSDIHGQLIVLQDVFTGRLIRPIPHATDASAQWATITDARGNGLLGEIRAAWNDVRAAFTADDGQRFRESSAQLAAALLRTEAPYRPSTNLMATELRYNALHPFRTAWMVMLAGALLATAAAFIRRRWFDVIAVLGMIAGFALLTYGLSLRWAIAGRIPAANMFESLLFVSWGTGAAAILSMVFVRHRAVPLVASAMGALSLILADVLPLDSFIRPIAPVLLDTVWMSIHVPVIMVSYSVLALAVLVAHAQLGFMAFVPSRRNTVATMTAAHYWLIQVGSLLLFAGIATGSMWAASSWGRYWGWDPKEVWSLVAFLAYMAILHVRIRHEAIPKWAYGVGVLLTAGVFWLVARHLAPISGSELLAIVGTLAAVALFLFAQGEFATAFKSVLAFWLIIMTYVGVNYVLGIGLHSYGFGTGAVVRYMFLIGSVDLGLVGLCTVVYLARRRRDAVGSPLPAWAPYSN